MINPSAIMKLMSMKSTFENNHPKFAAFLTKVMGQHLTEGTILEISIQRPGEEKICTNMKVTKSDLELIEELKQLRQICCHPPPERGGSLLD